MKSIILVGSFLAIVFVLNIGNAEAKAVPETENPVEPEGEEYQEAPRAGKTFYKYKTYHHPDDEDRTFSLTKTYYPSSTRYYPRYYSSYSPRYYSSYTPRRYYDNSYTRRYGTTHFIGKRSVDEADQKTEEQEVKEEHDELRDEEIEELNAKIEQEQELATREEDATEIDEPKDGKTFYKYKSYYPSSTRYHSRYYSSNYPRYYSSYYPRSYSRYYPRYSSSYYPRSYSRYYPRYSSSYYPFRTYYPFHF